MILYCKEFTIDGQKITMGHDRETGNRYIIKEIEEISACFGQPCTIWLNSQNFIKAGYSKKSVNSVIKKLKSIFWID